MVKVEYFDPLGYVVEVSHVVALDMTGWDGHFDSLKGIKNHFDPLAIFLNV